MTHWPGRWGLRFPDPLEHVVGQLLCIEELLMVRHIFMPEVACCTVFGFLLSVGHA